MIVSVLIKQNRALLYTLFSDRKRNVYLSVLASLGRHYSEFDRVKRPSGISAGQICQKIKRIIINDCVKSPESVIFIGDCTHDERFYVVACQKL